MDHLSSSSGGYALSVTYLFGGFLPPLVSGGSYHAGRTILVQFQLFDANHVPVSTASAQIYVDGQPGTSNGASNTGNNFRYDPTAQTYLFNLSTKGLSLGTHTITVTLDDGTSYSIAINLK